MLVNTVTMRVHWVRSKGNYQWQHVCYFLNIERFTDDAAQGTSASTFQRHALGQALFFACMHSPAWREAHHPWSAVWSRRLETASIDHNLYFAWKGIWGRHQAPSRCSADEHGRHLGISTTSQQPIGRVGNSRDIVFSAHLHVALSPNSFWRWTVLPKRSRGSQNEKAVRWWPSFLPTARDFGSAACNPGPDGRLLVCIPAPVLDAEALKPVHAGPPRFTELSKSAVFPPRRSVRKRQDMNRVVCFLTERSKHQSMALLAEKGDESLYMYDSPGPDLVYSDRTDLSIAKTWKKGPTLELQALDNAYKAMTEPPPPQKDTDVCATVGPTTLGRNALPTPKRSARDPSLHIVVVVFVVVALLSSLLAAILAGVALTKNSNETTVREAVVVPTKKTLVDAGTQSKTKLFFGWLAVSFLSLKDQ